jgi:hypothetical protein
MVNDLGASAMLPAGLLAMLAAFAIVAFIVAILVYVYMSLAFMAIAKKTRYSMPGLAWIPVVGPALIASKTAKMHWWPILLLIGIVIPFIGSLAQLAFAVFFIIWMWKTFEAIDRPGWWAILCIIPVVNLVLIGIAAWSKK